MESSEKGVYVDDYLEYSSTLPAELQRLLSNMRELDERAEGFISLAEDQTKYCVRRSLQSHNSKKESYEFGETELKKTKKLIKANQNNALNLCIQKIMLAKQAYNLVEEHIKRLDEDLNPFAKNLKQEEEIPQDEPAILPPLRLVIKEETRKEKKRKEENLEIQLKKNRKRNRNQQRNSDFAVMPPPKSSKKSVFAKVDNIQPIDPDEPTYCVCDRVSFGGMIACDNKNCKGGEWFHFSCVGLKPEMSFKGKWFCPKCRNQK